MGKAWKFGENLNTDEIIPARYNITIDEKELAKNVFCEIKPSFPKLVKLGDVVVAGANFGCGSSREHAPIAIKGSGAACVIAASYARIFFRNAINIGLPILESPEAAAAIEEGDVVQVDLVSGSIHDLTQNKTFQARPLPAFVQQIAAAGGIVRFLKEHNLEELL
ncbi:MAG: 3-isopropylmalate dehydratase small subunit [Kiritimatiellota bacterium]|nr:3-isopropylmalate dehydratase small subunit [Kiritimatiellota bacterium]